MRRSRDAISGESAAALPASWPARSCKHAELIRAAAPLLLWPAAVAEPATSDDLHARLMRRQGHY